MIMLPFGPLVAQGPLGNFMGSKKPPTKEQQEKTDQKNQATYEKLKTDAEQRYTTNTAFKESVDASFDSLLRTHKATAYSRNISRGSKIYAVHEDRFRIHEGLYDNLLVQDHINRIGQNLVPKDSDKVFAFRLLPDPTPNAETLATGTIYISTGMLALLDNEAQVAYVLAHEMAHIQQDHWRLKVKMEQELPIYNADQEKKGALITSGLSILGAGIGGAVAKSVTGAVVGAASGAVAGMIANQFINQQAVVSWDRAQEDEADALAFKYLLEAKYDVREIPKLYVALENTASKDTRTTLGFLGERNRVKQRREKATDLVEKAHKADIELQLKNGGFSGDSANHRNLMAELKRDNGIMAYFSDMFQIARQNLEEAVSIRSNDSAAQYYLGKVLETTGRTAEDRKAALKCFAKAAENDPLQENFGSHLHYALMMMGEQSPNNEQITKELDTYVTDYVKSQIEYSKSLLLPPNLETIYDYMSKYGNVNWHYNLPDEAKDMRVTPASLTPDATTAKAPEAPKPPAPAQQRVKLPVCPPGTPAAMVGKTCVARQ
jgi:tetratricopeptide (TPR) repeat protein